MECFQAAQSRRADHVIRQGMDDDSSALHAPIPVAFFDPRILRRSLVLGFLKRSGLILSWMLDASAMTRLNIQRAATPFMSAQNRCCR